MRTDCRQCFASNRNRENGWLQNTRMVYKYDYNTYMREVLCFCNLEPFYVLLLCIGAQITYTDVWCVCLGYCLRSDVLFVLVASCPARFNGFTAYRPKQSAFSTTPVIVFIAFVWGLSRRHLISWFRIWVISS